MSEIESSPPSNPPVNAAPVSPAPMALPVHLPPAQQVPRWVQACIAGLAILLFLQWWSARQDMNDMRLELARRLQQGDLTNTEAKLVSKTAEEEVKELQSKVSVLEGKQIEAQSQQLALEQLYQDLSKNRDDWALAEIEQVLSTASQQLQLAGNVSGAVIALQNADRSLSRSDKPQFITIRRAIAKDLDMLKSLAVPDTTGIALQLDTLISGVDGMPLLSDEKPSLPATPPKPSRRPEPKATASNARGQDNQWSSSMGEKWQSWTEEMSGELRQLIRVRSVDTPDALLLSPTQAYYAKENLKLRLLNARLGLLTRNELAFRSDMNAAQDEIGKYFDTRAKQTQSAQMLLKKVQSSNVSIEMPALVESLNAVRNYKAKP